MRLPEVISSLLDQGVIDEVVRPLQSGKEAQVYMVRADGELRVAKVYKDAQHRSFKQRAQYTEGRRVRNTRDQRAMAKHTRHGKAQEEDAWKSAEVDIIYRLHAQGVRVPVPYHFIDGVLLMELVQGADGNPAPRLGELTLDKETARSFFEQLLREVVKMLCAGIVHGDLSDFNVLVDAAGPVIIDFPQSVDAAQNRNARKLLVRDVNNLSSFLARCIPGTPRRPYGEEIWAAYENNLLTPGFALTGKFQRSTKPVDIGRVLDAIGDADDDERLRREMSGEALRRRRREAITAAAEEEKLREASRLRRRGARGTPGKSATGPGAGKRSVAGQGGRNASAAAGGSAAGGSNGKARPSRRRRRGRGGASAAKGDSPRSSAAKGDSARASVAEGTPGRRRRRRRGRGGGATRGSGGP